MRGRPKKNPTMQFNLIEEIKPNTEMTFKEPIKEEVKLDPLPNVLNAIPPNANVFVQTTTTQLQSKRPATPIENFQIQIEKYERKIFPSLLDKHRISTEQFKQIVLSEIKKNTKLLEAFMANPSSMFASILAGAEIGLTPSSIHGEFFLIPRKIDGVLTVTPLIGYKGLHKLLLRSGDIIKIHTECVFKDEKFEVLYGLEPTINHVPNFTSPRNSANITHVYSVAKLKTGDYQFVVLGINDIKKIRGISKYENHLYFNDKDDPMHWMVRKTALVQLGKLLPKDIYGTTALDIDNRLEGGATLVLDEDSNGYKIVDGKKISPVKFPNLKESFGALPNLEEQ